MVIYILTKFGADWLTFVDARVLTRKLWMDRQTDGHRRTLSDHNSSLSIPCSGELKRMLTPSQFLFSTTPRLIIRTRGPWWLWITRVIFPTIEFYIFVTLVPTCDPQGGASFDSKGIIWIRLIKVNIEMLNTKYQSSYPFSFREEEFWS